MRDVIDSRVKKARRFRILPPAGGGQSRRRRPSWNRPIPTLCWSRSCCRRRRPTSSVNIATPPAVRARPDPAADGRARRGRACATRSRPSACSTPRRRTSSLCREALIRDHGGEVPRTREELEALPGRRPQDRQCRAQHRLRRGDVRGRHPRLPRVATAPAWRRARTSLEVEAKLERLVPQPFRRDAHHWLILHGRYICKARTPECWRCPVVDLCRYKPKTPPPPENGLSPAPLEPRAQRRQQLILAEARCRGRGRQVVIELDPIAFLELRARRRSRARSGPSTRGRSPAARTRRQSRSRATRSRADSRRHSRC